MTIWLFLKVLVSRTVSVCNVDVFCDACIAKLKAEGKLEASLAKREVSEKEVDTRGKTYLQLLKERRDYKRRRQKYRAKNVHITRRTPTEVRLGFYRSHSTSSM